MATFFTQDGHAPTPQPTPDQLMLSDQVYDISPLGTLGCVEEQPYC